jgi:DNA repair exonuclease SbcCD nuclease subunit
MDMPTVSSLFSASLRPPLAAHAHSVRLLHTSDVHVGDERRSAGDGEWPETGIASLARMTKLAREHGVDAILIAGDLFDHNRVPEARVALVARIFEAARIPVVILPGNHDPHMPGGVYMRCSASFPSNVHVISRGEGELIALAEPGIQVWGCAHTSYDDWAPTAEAPAWHQAAARPLWRIALAHGLYVRSEYEARLSYRIHSHELANLQAHYVALGHLEMHESVGEDEAVAYYAGALDRSGGATIVTLAPEGVEVAHMRFPQYP